MSDRDRLIELIVNADTHDSYECRLCTKKDISCIRCDAEKFADYLLANGVIAPPCKVGDTVWHKEEGYLLDSYKIKFIYNDMTASNISRDLLFSVEDFGKTVFLTKEEAEAELRKRSNDNA